MQWAILVVLVLILAELLWFDHVVRLLLLGLNRAASRNEETTNASLETLQDLVRELKRLQGR